MSNIDIFLWILSSIVLIMIQWKYFKSLTYIRAFISVLPWSPSILFFAIIFFISSKIAKFDGEILNKKK